MLIIFVDYRRRKQAIIILILLVILGLIGTGVYFKWFYQKPTCFDTKQNQNETGIDCGGPCIPCERLTIKDPEIEWVKFLELQDKVYDLAVKIDNPNPNFGLEKFKYTFEIYDETGALIKEQAGASFILPAEKKYLIEGNVAVGKKIGKVELNLEKSSKDVWKKLKKDFESPDIYIHSKQFQYLENQVSSARASGIIKNNSGFDFETISVAVVLFNEDKEIVGVNKTEVKTVLAGEERYFSVLWFAPFKAAVKSAEMQAETNLFLDENFMRRYGAEPEKFQEYPGTTK
ncbi:MAG: Uncharacterized protein LiPW39_248 [Parcubacteria group bacterium LiPW_39]|nr:MAG: Uncharacterized protein LiPW39_248 [Parcubacteria group bacterium LiPW_39]